MQLARDGRIILDVDDTIETHHISTQLKCSSSPWKPKYTQPRGRVNTELISSLEEKLITIQFRSLEPVVILIRTRGPVIETNPFMAVSNKPEVDEEGWTLVTRQRPGKQILPQSPLLRHRKTKERKKSPRHSKGKKKSKNVKRYKICLLTSLSRTCLSLSHSKSFSQQASLRKLQST